MVLCELYVMVIPLSCLIFNLKAPIVVPRDHRQGSLVMDKTVSALHVKNQQLLLFGHQFKSSIAQERWLLHLIITKAPLAACDSSEAACV